MGDEGLSLEGRYCHALLRTTRTLFSHALPEHQQLEARPCRRALLSAHVMSGTHPLVQCAQGHLAGAEAGALGPATEPAARASDTAGPNGPAESHS